MSGDDRGRGATNAGAANDRSDRSKSDADREQRRNAEQMKADAQRKADLTRAEERRVAEVSRRAEQKRTDQRRDAQRKESQQRAQNVKAAAEKETARKQALAADIRRRAEAAVLDLQNRQKAQQLYEHRRETDHVRALHRVEMQSHRGNEADAVDRHAQEIRGIDDKEREAMGALGARRESLIGRSVTLIKGHAHYDRKAEAISENCEAARMFRHRELEALKERQFAAAQQTRLRQAHERKDIFEIHRVGRQQLVEAHERDREAQIGAYEHAFERAAQREERRHEPARGLGRGRSR